MIRTSLIWAGANAASATAPSTDGTLRRALLVLALLAGSSLVWWLLSRRRGQFRPTTVTPSEEAGLLLDTLGRDRLGERATFVLFTSATCSTCPGVRRVLSGLVTDTPGAALLEVRAEDQMDLVRTLGVLRTPTVLLLDSGGEVRSRTSGPVTHHQATAGLSSVLPMSASGSIR